MSNGFRQFSKDVIHSGFGHALPWPETELTKRHLLLSYSTDWEWTLGGQMKIWVGTIKADMAHLGFQPVFGARDWHLVFALCKSCWRSQRINPLQSEAINKQTYPLAWATYVKVKNKVSKLLSLSQSDGSDHPNESIFSHCRIFGTCQNFTLVFRQCELRRWNRWHSLCDKIACVLLDDLICITRSVYGWWVYLWTTTITCERLSSVGQEQLTERR